MKTALLGLLLSGCSAASLIDVAAGAYAGGYELHEVFEEQRRTREHKACISGKHWSGVEDPCASERPMTAQEIAELETNQ